MALPGMTVKPMGFRCLEATLARTLVRLRPAETVIPSSRAISVWIFREIDS